MNGLKEFWQKNYESILKPTIVLLVICIVIAFALSLTNKVTAPKIAVLTEKQQQESMQQLMDADSFAEKAEKDIAYYEAVKSEQTVGYVFLNETKGYGGTVSVMTAIDPDGTVHAVKILDVTSETPGLGQNSAKENFYGQYAGKKDEITVVKFGANEQQVNAVTGATITSKAVTTAVNEALKQFETVTGEVKGNE